MYLVYKELGDGTKLTRCICSTAADAEEMCLELTWESWYSRCFIDDQIVKPKGHSSIYTQIPDSLLHVDNFNYEEVPFVG